MADIILVNLEIHACMGRVNYFGLIKIKVNQFTKEIFKLIFFMGLVSSFGLMEIFMRVNLKMVNIMVVVNSDGLIQSINTRVSSRKVRCMVREYSRTHLEYLRDNLDVDILMEKGWQHFRMEINTQVILSNHL